MTVYLVCNNVDLGYHVEYAYTTQARAEAKMAELIEADKQHYIKSVMTATAYRAGLTYDEAVKAAEQRRKNWEIVEMRVEE
jgi:uncharacterized protein YfcZ (UPF0381/DUF406 family)